MIFTAGNLTRDGRPLSPQVQIFPPRVPGRCQRGLLTCLVTFFLSLPAQISRYSLCFVPNSTLPFRPWGGNDLGDGPMPRASIILISRPLSPPNARPKLCASATRARRSSDRRASSHDSRTHFRTRKPHSAATRPPGTLKGLSDFPHPDSSQVALYGRKTEAFPQGRTRAKRAPRGPRPIPETVSTE